MTYIYEELTESDFINGFYGSYSENFTYEARKALFEFFSELAEDCPNGIRFDAIAICCTYAEYEDLEEFNREYGEECEDLEDVQDKTDVIKIPGTERFIIVCY